MASKFLAGFVTGIFVSTKYDFKPYVSLVEDKLNSLHKELEQKRDEQKEKEKPQVPDNWGFNWPWSQTVAGTGDSKKN